GRYQLLVGEALLPKVLAQLLPAARCIADAEHLRRRPLEPALVQEAAARHRLCRFRQLPGVELGRCAVCIDEPGAPLAVPFRRSAGPCRLVSQLQPDLVGEPLHRLREGQLVVLLHERDDVAALAAGAEAVPQPPRRRDVKRGSLLVVERAEPFKRTAARAAQRDVLSDDLVDLGPLTDRCDVLVAYPPR